ncbi:uncharacterized protein Ecym_6387 [Eremothecium cymbalariae DBVPG|uniref:PH domain-containing protein n=1 Tax=Eremothecium cymbalariae (strain CBS 270.75 / DBVPG 7215 / KCTC 17166 / NRRL Y-17582) TaxID=931890 RepID=G8JUI2_ERECY|nr:hypothetical protein Ecym_6387 [Eremothecium cymbalariae DBVPG\
MLPLLDPYQHAQIACGGVDKVNSLPSSVSASSIEGATTLSFDSRSRNSLPNSLSSCQENGQQHSYQQHQQGLADCCSYGCPQVPQTIPEVPGYSRSSDGQSYGVPVYVPPNDDVMMWIDPMPARPPPYRSVNANQRIAYPVFEREEDGCLPAYRPAVYDVTVVMMKLEWVSPYQPATMRAWKHYIMEINSTQLNFYHIDDSLVRWIKENHKDSELDSFRPRAAASSALTDSASSSSSQHSSRFFSLHFSKEAYQFTGAEQEWIARKVKGDRKRYLSKDKLYKSYSLQFATFGIPMDYKKKSYVLRMRCQTNQFLLNFAYVDDMIMWNVLLSVGIGVALDLDQREMPSYRTVPRRRRCRRRRKRRTDNLATAHARGSAKSTSFVNCSRYNNVLGLVATSLERHQIWGSGRERSSNKGLPTADFGLGLGWRWRRRRPDDSCLNVQMSRESAYRHSCRTNESTITNITSRLKNIFTHDKKHCTTSTSLRMDAQNINGLYGIVEAKNEERFQVPSFPKSSLLKKHGASSASPVIDSGRQITHNGPSLMSSDTVSASTDSSSTTTPPIARLSSVTDPAVDRATGPSIGVETINIVPTIPEGFKPSGFREEHPVVCETEEEVIGAEDVDEDSMEVDISSNEGSENTQDDSHHSYHRTHNSIYLDEGILSESEDDYMYDMNNVPISNRLSGLESARWVTSSPNISSQLNMQFEYGSTQEKWNQPKKEIPRRRYIRDSLRCIRPLYDDDPWLGTILVHPVNVPLPSHCYQESFVDNSENQKDFISLSITKSRSGKRHHHHHHHHTNNNGRNQNNSNSQFLRSCIVGPMGLVGITTNRVPWTTNIN